MAFFRTASAASAIDAEGTLKRVEGNDNIALRNAPWMEEVSIISKVELVLVDCESGKHDVWFSARDDVLSSHGAQELPVSTHP